MIKHLHQELSERTCLQYANVENISIGRFSYVGGHNESLPIHLNLEYYEDDHGLTKNDAEVIYGTYSCVFFLQYSLACDTN